MKDITKKIVTRITAFKQDAYVEPDAGSNSPSIEEFALLLSGISSVSYTHLGFLWETQKSFILFGYRESVVSLYFYSA